MPYLAPPEIVAAIADSAVKKARLDRVRLLGLSILGGAYIALGGLLAVFIGAGFPAAAQGNPALPKLLMGLVFPLGLMLVAIAGAELFTGNAAYFAAGVVHRRVSTRDLVHNWTWVFAGNFLGALFVAGVITYATGVLSASPWREYLIHLAELKTGASFLTVFCKAIGCNWLVALAMWQAMSAKDTAGKVLAIWPPIFGFVALGFEHCVANMFFIPAAMFLGAKVSLSQFLVGNLLPATLGNIVGGALLVGASYAFLYQPKEGERAPFRELEEGPSAELIRL